MSVVRRSAAFSALFCLSCATPPPEEPPQPLASPAAPTPSPSSAPPSAPPGPVASAAPVASAPEPVDAEGCVRAPRRHAVAFVLAHHAAPVAERLGRPPVESDFEGAGTCLATTELPDVDGDGAPETVVSEGCSWGTAAALQLLYFSARGCPRFAGALVNGELSPRAESAAGVRDLEATWSNGCAGGDFAWTHYRWDGTAYGVLDQATCHLCTDPSAPRRPAGANAHPHCKAEAKSRGVALR